MKRLIYVLTITLVLTGLTGLAHAQRPGGMHRGGMMGDSAMSRGDSAMMGCMGMGMGMGMMVPRQIAPVNGGVVVLFGNKLIKFDRNLNKKEEVTLELDEETMRNMIEQMQRMRSLHQEMMSAPAGESQEDQ